MCVLSSPWPLPLLAHDSQYDARLTFIDARRIEILDDEPALRAWTSAYGRTLVAVSRYPSDFVLMEL
jgi:hypothetical protein